MTPPIRQLSELLASASPRLNPRAVAIVALEGDVSERWLRQAIGVFREAEGVTLYLDQEIAEREGLPIAMRAAQITMTVHSALDAVGFTAAFARALADAGISCNVVAGARHDHLFAPWEKREDAMRVLQALSETAKTARS